MTDPATGLGTPDFSQLSDAVDALPAGSAAPTTQLMEEEDSQVTACGCTCACAGVECAGLPFVPICASIAKQGATSCANFAAAANKVLSMGGGARGAEFAQHQAGQA